MQIGIGLPNQVRDVTASTLPRWAVRAEGAGFSTLATTGRYAYPGVSDTVALAAAAGATTTIGLLSAGLLAPTWPGALLAKEIAGIDGVSGARLTLGVGVGSREDEFTVSGHDMHGRGARLESDLATYREIWSGAPVGNGPNPAVPSDTRQVPMLFGGYSARALDRMVRWGEGYIGGSLPPAMTAPPSSRSRSSSPSAAWLRAPQAAAFVCRFGQQLVISKLVDVRLGSPIAGAAQAELVATNLRSIKEARNESVALCTCQASK
ncbi:LLM class flavin-dependent oxidoreductase [Streptomyces sp. NPDC093707]|uniref:LLM class flavin-dependent oxidoreductase n=1 Tax=Streptomyces sp. NPDC093707 TaxID=3154984 RepID=UPI00344E3295